MPSNRVPAPRNRKGPKTINFAKLQDFWSNLTPALRARLAKLSGYAELSIYQGVRGNRKVEPAFAAALDEANAKIVRVHPTVPRLRREDWCATCAACPYAKRVAESRNTSN